jgi:hypothetical protein
MLLRHRAPVGQFDPLTVTRPDTHLDTKQALALLLGRCSTRGRRVSQL